MILVDTSVWVDHLRRSNTVLVGLLENDQVLMHPFVVGEIACGNLGNRETILSLMDSLPSAIEASHRETRLFIEQAAFMGSGLGFIDLHLLASARLTPNALLWTEDRRLHTAADALSLAWQPPG
ncbi:type II toxin-antitoxin system VapC family toxin [Chromatocurvus halotolerans]|uniref:PIN domain-containing protein n=1 Tax=Chromatocurvus halotolerans TaxID=1132028 RepID=A0A4R2KQC1_9GAMM|nr:type II toxin-antitoxin system VapC family toxin [Chromatocurvus halotolerans]TCO74877.1 hypothetical protein EV688_11134 [Chromatocurvus halotolerans]